MGKSKGKKTNTRQKKDSFDFNNLMGSMLGGLGGPGMAPTQEKPKGVLKSFNSGDVDIDFSDNFYLDLTISVNHEKGLLVIPLSEKLGFGKKVFLPPVTLFYLFKLPKEMVIKYFKPVGKKEHGYFLDNNFDTETISKILNEDYFKKLSEEEEKNIDNFRLYFEWSKLEKDDIVLSSDYAEQSKSKLHEKIMKEVFETYFEISKYKINFEEFYKVICDYSAETIKSKQEIAAFGEDKLKEIERDYEEKIMAFFGNA